MLLMAAVVPVSIDAIGNFNSVSGGPSGTAIKTVDDLMNVANDLGGDYYLDNNIFFIGQEADTNGGAYMNVSAVFNGTNTLTIAVTPADPTIAVTEFRAAINSNMVSVTTNVINISVVGQGEYTITAGGKMVGGTLLSEDTFAFSQTVTLTTGTSGTVLDVDINSNGNFTPIGSYSTPFAGTFDGNGYAIYGLNVAVYNPAGAAYAGLFACTGPTAVIKNLGVEPDRYGRGSVFAISMTQSYAGGITGVSKGSQITDCYNSNKVAVFSNDPADMGCAGGIVGSDIGTNAANVILNCRNGGAVTALTASGKRISAGGIIGATNYTSIEGCNNSGKISSISNIEGGGTDDTVSAGGIAGYVKSLAAFNTTNSYNTGLISGEATYRDARIGGIIGFIDTTNLPVSTQISVTRCYNTGKLQDVFYRIGTNNAATQVGGIVGEIAAFSGAGTAATNVTLNITQCYNTGEINANTQWNVFAGGILGEVDRASASITDCYNVGSIIATSTTDGVNKNAGGIMGAATATATGIHIFNCYNAGTLTLTNILSPGGILGSSQGAWNTAATRIINSYFLTNTAVTNFISGGQTTVQFRDEVNANTPASSGTTANPVRSTASPNQTTNASKSSSDMRPTLAVAQAGGSIFFTGTTTVGAGTVQSIVPGWDFTDNTGIWTIDGVMNSGYPVLRAFVQDVSLTPDVTTGKTITISPEYYGQTHPQYDQYYLVGDAATFSVSSVLDPNNTGQTVQYQWQTASVPAAGSSPVWSNIPVNPVVGANGSSFTLSPIEGADNGTMYRCAVTSPGYGGTVYSDPVTIYVITLVTAKGTGFTADTGFIPDGSTIPDPERAVYGDKPIIALTTASGADVPERVQVVMNGAILSYGVDFTYYKNTGILVMHKAVDGDMTITAIYAVTVNAAGAASWVPMTLLYGDMVGAITFSIGTADVPTGFLVVMGGSVLVASGQYTYDPATPGTITISGTAVGNITATAVYTVTLEGSGFGIMPDTSMFGDAYSGTIYAVGTAALPAHVKITAGGTVMTSADFTYSSANGTVTFTVATPGNIVVKPIYTVRLAADPAAVSVSNLSYTITTSAGATLGPTIYTVPFEVGADDVLKISAADPSASPAGYDFTRWSDDIPTILTGAVDYTLSDSSAYLTAGAVTFTAGYQAQGGSGGSQIFTVTLAVNHLTIALSDLTYTITTPGGMILGPFVYTAPFKVGINETLDVGAAAVVGYGFIKWSDDDGMVVSAAPNMTGVDLTPYKNDMQVTFTAAFNAVPKTYYITSNSDPNSSIAPKGNIAVQAGNDRTFAFSAADGYIIASVTVDGTPLTQAQIDAGSYTFYSVNTNHTIGVSSSRGSHEPITMTINIEGGNGHVVYSVNGSPPMEYVSPVTFESGDNVIVTAVPDDAYEFDMWTKGDTIITQQSVSFNGADLSVPLKLHFIESGDSSLYIHVDTGWLWGSLSVLVLLIFIGLIVWFILFWRVPGFIITVRMNGEAVKGANVTFTLAKGKKTENGVKRTNFKGRFRVAAKKDSIVTISMIEKDGNIASGVPLVVVMENRREEREINFI
ncbi:hypothetical protein Mpt1_c12390 [Candidatus Methanoplasma termitum]|uniref:Bacterial repeat domain-containing protein n=1 Tax=Candidatus Methanoplasma termitum TaxID=1577791 RepID=A0A0A7LHZ6_9ARCH|nr:hypothetical protein Mpt1_c12390 [Candidatus Methanoplasma termitum]